MSKRRCAHCERYMDHAEGAIHYVYPDETTQRVDLCHPADGSPPDCYHLVTVYHEDLGSRKSSASSSAVVSGTTVKEQQ